MLGVCRKAFSAWHLKDSGLGLRPTTSSTLKHGLILSGSHSHCIAAHSACFAWAPGATDTPSQFFYVCFCGAQWRKTQHLVERIPCPDHQIPQPSSTVLTSILLIFAGTMLGISHVRGREFSVRRGDQGA